MGLIVTIIIDDFFDFFSDFLVHSVKNIVNVIIEAYLSEPPSSIHCFRDVTLYANCIINKTVLVECEKYEKDMYYKWLKSFGAYDFVEDIVSIDKEKGYKIGLNKGNIAIDRISEVNLNLIITKLNMLNG